MGVHPITINPRGTVMSKSNTASPTIAAQTLLIKKQQLDSGLFLKGPLYFAWLLQHIPDPASRLILIARAFGDMGRGQRVKLTRKVWESAGIYDKDTRSRVVTKIGHHCKSIKIDAKQGRCTYLEFRGL